MADSPAPTAATPEGKSSVVAVLVGLGSTDGAAVPDGVGAGTALVGADVAAGAEVSGAEVAEGVGKNVGSAPGEGWRLVAVVGVTAGKSSAWAGTIDVAAAAARIATNAITFGNFTKPLPQIE
jgi:hypothetical protein